MEKQLTPCLNVPIPCPPIATSISGSKKLVAKRPNVTQHDRLKLGKPLRRESVGDQSASPTVKRFVDYGQKALGS